MDKQKQERAERCLDIYLQRIHDLELTSIEFIHFNLQFILNFIGLFNHNENIEGYKDLVRKVIESCLDEVTEKNIQDFKEKRKKHFTSS